MTMEWSANGRSLYVVHGAFSASTDDFVNAISSCSLEVADLVCAIKGVFVGSLVRRLAVNPMDKNEVFAATTAFQKNVTYFYDYDSPAVYHSTDGGASWAKIDTPSSQLDTAALGAAAVYIRKDDVNTVAIGTSNGVLVPDGSNSWKVLAEGLPTVAVFDMVYDRTDDLLIVATLGRGPWILPEASKVVSSNSTRRLGAWKPVQSGEAKNRELDSVSVDFGSWVKKQEEILGDLKVPPEIYPLEEQNPVLLSYTLP